MSSENLDCLKKGSTDESSSSPEILRDASLQETLDEHCLELMNSAEAENLEVQRLKTRNDTPWPSHTESKIPPRIGLTLYSEEEQSESKGTEYLTPNRLDFSIFVSPSSIVSDVSLNLKDPLLGDAPPNTPNLSNLEEELTKKAQQQEENLKEHLGNLTPRTGFQQKGKKRGRKQLDFDSEKDRKMRKNKAMEELKRLVPGLVSKSAEIEVYEMTVKYLEFVKSQIGLEVDKEFLMKQIF